MYKAFSAGTCEIRKTTSPTLTILRLELLSPTFPHLNVDALDISPMGCGALDTFSYWLLKI